MTADLFLCVLCGALIRSDPGAPPDTTWFDTFDDDKPYHAACWDIGRRQIVMLPTMPHAEAAA